MNFVYVLSLPPRHPFFDVFDTTLHGMAFMALVRLWHTVQDVFSNGAFENVASNELIWKT